MMNDDLLRAYLATLRVDMDMFRESIREVSEDVRKEGYSKFPIFVAHQASVKLGEVILDREELQSNFTIQASTLEEFVERKVILPENLSKFKSAYKDPDQYCCIFLVTEHGAQFVFVPYDNKESPAPDNKS